MTMDFVLFFFIMLLQREVGALKLLNVTVPSYVLKGESAHLKCSYDTEFDKMYKVSWYKDGNEFYKYSAKSKTRTHTYPVPGVNLEMRSSNYSHIHLYPVNTQTTGVYKCEVSGESKHGGRPPFTSVTGEGHLQVIALPEEDPTITGEEKIYASGDVLSLNCTSSKTFPKTRLKWFINDVLTAPDSEGTSQHYDLFITTSTLRLELGPHHLLNGRIKIRCEAIIDTHEKVEDLQLSRRTEVFVQGHANDSTPSILMVLALLVLRLCLMD